MNTTWNKYTRGNKPELECYTKKRNDGSNYTTCVEGQKKENKLQRAKRLGKLVIKPKIPTINITEAQPVIYDTRQPKNVLGPYKPTAKRLYNYGAEEQEEVDPEAEEEEVDPEAEEEKPEESWLDKAVREKKSLAEEEEEAKADLIVNKKLEAKRLKTEDYNKRRTDLINRLVKAGDIERLQELLRRIKLDPSRTGIVHNNIITLDNKIDKQIQRYKDSYTQNEPFIQEAGAGAGAGSKAESGEDIIKQTQSLSFRDWEKRKGNQKSTMEILKTQGRLFGTLPQIGDIGNYNYSIKKGGSMKKRELLVYHIIRKKFGVRYEKAVIEDLKFRLNNLKSPKALKKLEKENEAEKERMKDFYIRQKILDPVRDFVYERNEINKYKFPKLHTRKVNQLVEEGKSRLSKEDLEIWNKNDYDKYFN